MVEKHSISAVIVLSLMAKLTPAFFTFPVNLPEQEDEDDMYTDAR